jgi:hypothetical protein
MAVVLPRRTGDIHGTTGSRWNGLTFLLYTAGTRRENLARMMCRPATRSFNDAGRAGSAGMSRRQWLRLAIAAGGLASALPRLRADAAPATSPTAIPTATQPATRPAELSAEQKASLRSACEGLAARAVRSGFGWGWSDDEEPVDLTRQRPPGGKMPMIDAFVTARIGLLMLRAGELLDEPGFVGVAFEAGRGVLGVQARSGQIRSHGAMGAFGGHLDDAADLPDRRPTRVAVALLMELADNDARAGREPDARLRGPAQQAAHWLTRQQTTIGGWPVIYPPDAPRGQGQRLIRLDETDFRDTALAVLLASDVLGDRLLRNKYDRSAAHLCNLRVSAGTPPVHALWCGYYKPDGDLRPKNVDLLQSIDLLATRHAAETLLAGMILPGDNNPRDPLDEAVAAALTDLPPATRRLKTDDGGRLHRRYTLELRPIVPPAPPPPGPFEAAQPPPPPTPPHRMADLLATLDRLAVHGVDQLRADWQVVSPPRRRLAMVIGQVMPDGIVSPYESTETLRLRKPAGTLDASVQAAWDIIGGLAGGPPPK